MENFFIEYRDPIFGLIVLISMILLIAVLSYFWGVFHRKDEKQNLEKFIKKFESANALDKKYEHLLKNLDVDAQALGILATTFVKSGAFEKAISIYLIALEKAQSKGEREFILTNLGKVYFKAGFLERARGVLLESLRFSPRNVEALTHLIVIYERLKRYGDALEVLDALYEQEKEVYEWSEYIRALQISNDTKISFNEKIERILALNFGENSAKRMALELFIKHKEPLENLKEFPPLKSCIDLIYSLNECVNLTDSDYRALFYSKGLSDKSAKSEIFEINSLVAMRESGIKNGSLSFSYVCDECKSSIPLFFYRCPICYKLSSAHILPQITEKNDEISMPF